MWLLNTKTLELRDFPTVPYNRYAILSHVWEDDDKKYSFQSLKVLYETYRNSEEGPLPHAPDKVRKFCLLAAEEGYEWVWFDTCCIDKTSSAELSEAINSMYPWYEAAHVCYAYLFDVPDSDDPFSPGSAFRSSKYHERGWTLQELLAPHHVVFLSSSWSHLGTKAVLVTPLSESTGIDPKILLYTSVSWRHAVSVAQRMSWAARRITTRPEDRAYSLMGIFGVSMPVIYGEGGERAFLRLQKEVISLCRDQTIFAWGPIHPNFNVARDDIECHLESGELELHSDQGIGKYQALLATSPADFVHSAGLRRLEPIAHRTLFDDPVDHRCTFTADGISLRLPTSSYILRAQWGEVVHTAALSCTTVTQAANSDPVVCIILLFLSRRRLSRRDDWEDASQPLPFFHVGKMAQNGEGEKQYYRGAILWLQRCHWTSPFLERKSPLAHLCLRRRELRVAYDMTPAFMRSLARTGPSPPSQYGTYVFDIPSWVFNNMETCYGFTPSFSTNFHGIIHGALRFIINADGDLVAHSHSTFYILFHNAAYRQTLGMIFGLQCRCCLVCAGADMEIRPEFWSIRVFFARSIIDHTNPFAILEALEENEVLQEREDHRMCRRTHLHVLHPTEPVVFPITVSLTDEYASRALHLRSAFSGITSQDGSNASPVVGQFTVIMDFVEVERVWSYESSSVGTPSPTRDVL